MIQANRFLTASRDVLGVRRYTGVPCSFLTPLIDSASHSNELEWICAANEGDALATAAGSAIGGQAAVTMMQNSGLGNAINPLSSLAWVFRLPLLLLITHRGAPDLEDEPQHALMGKITSPLLHLLDVPTALFPSKDSEILPSLRTVQRHLCTVQRPYAYILPKGAMAAVEINIAPPAAVKAMATTAQKHIRHERPPKRRHSRREVLQEIVSRSAENETILVASTGYTGRELYALADRPNHFYMVGSMGCATSLGLGLALALPKWHIIVLEGDGAALMRMGNFATVGHHAGDNFSHIVLDNEMHDSTGGQATGTGTVQFAEIAAACGYPNTTRADTLDSLDSILDRREHNSGPRLLHLKIRAGTEVERLPRPQHHPEQGVRRLMAHIGVRFPQ